MAPQGDRSYPLGSKSTTSDTERRKRQVRLLRRRRIARSKTPIGRTRISQARRALKGFRQASMLAVALTSLFLVVADPGAAADPADADRSPRAATVEAPEQGDAFESVALADRDRTRRAAPNRPPSNVSGDVAERTSEEAKKAFSGVKGAVIRHLPKLALVLVLFAAAWVTVRAIRFVLRRALGNWPRSTAATAVSAVAIWVLVLGMSLTIIAGDVRAFLGSVGLVGLAASWALQTPIESFTGWLLNAFRGHYRVGDRIEVGEVFGDVHRIDVLTTTVWEIGSPFRPGFIRAEQPTGRIITFPNNQILTGTVVNYTRDLPYVWDELIVAIANESDVRYAMSVVQNVASELFAGDMQEPARQYQQTLQRAGLDDHVASEPEVFVSLEDSWTNLHVRYLVDARQRRGHKSELTLRLSETLNLPEHAERILPVLPRQQVQFIDANGRAKDADWFNMSDET